MTKRKMDKRKMLLILPFIILPFLALAFYALGGGQQVVAVQGTAGKGINTALPDAQFKKDAPADKMGIYELTKKDSTHADVNGIASVADRLGFDQADDPQTKAINEKLAAINKQVNTPVTAPNSYNELSRDVTEDAPVSKDVAKLEKLMKTMQESGKGDDPEMVQLNTLMDKIMAVQNPSQVKPQAQKPEAITDSVFKAIPAVIDGNQKVIEGSVVKLRLLDTITINGQLIPKGYPVFGLAKFSNQRLNLEIRNIRLGTSIIPVSLTVFDQTDAMIGINAPEAMLSDAASTGGADAISGIGLGFDQSLTTQLASAGLDAAKGLLTKKLKRIKQPLKSGYPLLLRANTQKTNH
ncbi:conjugative transposon protein TraM [Mucilaginibacter paludis]|uniref:Conjugative transposon TraM protein n=1 Tax=Mucilaginibacter paludis DSM 18603 TaxID=714943 RepID=H1YEA5_9SPHI|nr:conjugative transposon protein TraM [Mucilaginibacter paludis]EHQ26168.1 conjugative transposon TraM protein [Mucilaginibacter paludis DSM 18603]